MTPEERLRGLGLELPRPWVPGASLVMCVRHADVLHLSAHMGVDMTRTIEFHGISDHHPLVAGKVGREIPLEKACEIARGGSLNLIATIKQELGDLTRVRRFLSVTSIVNAVEDLDAIHKVADAASDLLVAVFGDAGNHARTTLGATVLPANSCFSIAAVVAVD